MNVTVELLAVVMGLLGDAPVALVRPRTQDERPALPSGPLEHSERSLQAGARRWVETLTGHHVGYMEQLYTFADADRADGTDRTISIGYLGLTRTADGSEHWVSCYDLLPWEDRRGSPGLVHDVLAPRLAAWAEAGGHVDIVETRRRRVTMTFGLDGAEWVPDLALQRYELLYEAGLLPEAPTHLRANETAPGLPMTGDHRRIVATALGRLRAKIQYRPVVFELLPPEFTLAELQRCVESIAGHAVHTQNFRRLVMGQRLVETSGGTAQTGGRPAQLYRFRAEVLEARAVAGTKLPVTRGGR